MALRPIHMVRTWPEHPVQVAHARHDHHHHHDHSVSNLGCTHRGGRSHFVGVALVRAPFAPTLCIVLSRLRFLPCMPLTLLALPQWAVNSHPSRPRHCRVRLHCRAARARSLRRRPNV